MKTYSAREMLAMAALAGLAMLFVWALMALRTLGGPA